MIKFPGINSALGFFLFLMHPAVASSSEKLLETSITTRAEYNDNIFLTTLPHGNVSSVVITPSLSGIIKEQHWQVKLNSKLRINKYSNQKLDSNERLFDLTGQHSADRNVFSINMKHDLISSVRSTSTDFAISSERIEHITQSVTPQYTRFLTERLVLTLSYSYSDTGYLDLEDVRFIASYTESGSAALRYNLSERNQLSINFQAVDYTRKDKLGDIQLLDINIGFNHQLSETLSVDLSVGASRRNSTNLQTTILDFFGTTILVPQEMNTKTRGNVFNFGVTQSLETGSFGARISRNTTTNSFGGVDERDKFLINHDEKFSSLWRYSTAVSYEDITSVSVATTSTDREVLFLEARAYYALTRNWKVSMSYRYSQRKFKNLSSGESTADSNRLHLGLAYNLPTLSTF